MILFKLHLQKDLDSLESNCIDEYFLQDYNVLQNGDD